MLWFAGTLVFAIVGVVVAVFVAVARGGGFAELVGGVVVVAVVFAEVLVDCEGFCVGVAA